MGGKLLVLVLAATVSFLVIDQCWAWGAIGHEWISGIANREAARQHPGLPAMSPLDAAGETFSRNKRRLLPNAGSN